jgi:hypothetical protein
LVLVTTLLDAEVYAREEVASLFLERWNMEISRPHYDRNDTLYQPDRSAYRRGVGVIGTGTVVSQAA